MLLPYFTTLLPGTSARAEEEVTSLFSSGWSILRTRWGGSRRFVLATDGVLVVCPILFTVLLQGGGLLSGFVTYPSSQERFLHW